MIPSANITAWRAKAPWAADAQVEQDLVLARAIVAIFSHPLLLRELAFRGGTALHKLFLRPPIRYSEDIDLVQVNAGPFGEVMTALRGQLDPWLGTPRWEHGQRGTKLVYRFSSEIPPVTGLRLKIEINTREHFMVHGLRTERFAVDSPWFDGAADVVTYSLEELLGTKLRALYQRKKGRDLLDLAVAFARVQALDPVKIVECFNRYMAADAAVILREDYQDNLAAKLDDAAFRGDIQPLLATTSVWDGDAAWDIAFSFEGNSLKFDSHAAAELLSAKLLSHLTSRNR